MSSRDATSVTSLDNDLFVARILKEIRLGSGFVPFVGSGCSSPSGILMGQQFDDYLSYTVFLCVADPATRKRGARWDLRENGWPELPTPKEVATARDWIRIEFDRICNACGFEAIPHEGAEIERLEPISSPQRPEDVAKALTCPLLPRILRAANCDVNQETLKRLLPHFSPEALPRGGYSVPGISPTSEDAITEKAIRSLYDWRSTLRFLSELQLVEGRTLLVQTAEPAIVDGFNISITRGRRPNLTHNMLCHLAGPARFRLIMTTNFDTLIEDAFHEMRDNIEVISVSIKGSLPDPEIVHARNTLVKMHGTLWETRADFSLDDSPPLEDKRRFFHYVRGAYPEEERKGLLPSHVLVCGYSGSDNRCVEMIKYVLDASPHAELFWVCHSEWDLKRVRAIFSESQYRGRISATVTERCDLLLYELYQRLCLSLPCGGFSFQYTHNVAPKPPKIRDPEYDTYVISEVNKLLGPTFGWFSSPQSPPAAHQTLLITDGDPGVLAILRLLTQRLTECHRISQIWLELEDYADTYCVAYEVLLILSIRLGLFQLNHADFLPDAFISECEHIRKHQSDQSLLRPYANADEKLTHLWVALLERLVVTYFNIIPSKWVIVLYGRNGPGGCAGWTQTGYWDSSKVGEEYGTARRVGRFTPLLKALVIIGFRVVYSPYSEIRFARDKQKPQLLQDVLSRNISNCVLRTSDEYRLPPPHKEAIRARWLKPTSSFGGAKLYSCVRPSGRPGQSIVDFEWSMNILCEGWLRGSASRNSKGGEKGQKERYLRNITFLYASTLFRQSRHYTAFLNEGAMRCPHRFNANGLDNDWLRDQYLRDYFGDLASVSLFYEKPGGFAWAYRDFRLGLRQMLESLSPHYFASFRAMADIEPPLYWRSYYSYWIADWYLRAFYTTGHATPLLEAVFHLYQVLRNIGSFRLLPASKRKSSSAKLLAWKRYTWWRAALGDIVKALRVGRPSIRLWLGAPQFRAWFPGGRWRIEFIAELHNGINDLLQELPRNTLQRLHAKSLLACLEEELRQLCLLERGDGRIKDFTNAFPPTHRYAKASHGSVLLDESRLNVRDDATWWNGVSGPISELFSLVFEHAQSHGLAANRILDRRVMEWQIDIVSRTIDDNDYCDLVQQLNEWAFLCLRRAKMRQYIINNRIAASGSSGPMLGLEKGVTVLWLLVTICASCAIAFCRLLHPAFESFDQKERVKALCLYGLALGRLGRFYEAQRRLNEASSLLSKSESQDNAVLLGILQLRRAEVHLLESVLISELPKRQTGDEIDRKHLYARYSMQTEKDAEKLLKLRIAKLDDAWCALENAERLLAGHLRNPLWWGRLCALKLRCLVETPEDPKGFCFRSLAERCRAEKFTRVFEIFRKGIASSLGRTSLQLRIIDLAMQAAVKVFGGADPSIARESYRRIFLLSEELLDAESRPKDSLTSIHARQIKHLFASNKIP